MGDSKDDNQAAPTRLEAAPAFARDATEQEENGDVFANTQADEPVAAPAPIPSRAEPELGGLDLDDEATEFDGGEMKTELQVMEIEFDDEEEPTATRKERGRFDLTQADPVEDISLGSLEEPEGSPDVFAEAPSTVADDGDPGDE